MLTRRNALLGLGLATAGCALDVRVTGLPPGIQFGNIAHDDNLVLGPDENILIGSVARIIRPDRFPTGALALKDAVGANLQSAARELEVSPLLFNGPPPYFVVEAAGHSQFGVQFPGQQLVGLNITQDEEQVRYLPFAMRVPKGPYKFVGLLNYSPNRSSWYWRRISPFDFNVRPGSVAYIGRFGQISQIIRYSETAFERQTQGLEVLRGGPRGDFRFFLAKAPAGSSSDLPRSCSGPFRDEAPGCLFQSFFFFNNADQDLPLLRQRFPKLANAQIIDAAPSPGGVDGWKRWPDVLRPLSVS